VAYFAASCDDPETNKKFATELELDYPILSDPEKKAVAAFGNAGALGLPSRTTFYIDAEGRIAFIDREVSTKTHGTDVASRLAVLGAPRAK
jgi:thioredoxin-dependent peroxiredoxin